ncbi:hypothetical protein B566_EDAN004128 [Ephemera danica]|nr:hypothetical protein B566_EDAN004128 [Ephemera danica]
MLFICKLRHIIGNVQHSLPQFCKNTFYSDRLPRGFLFQNSCLRGVTTASPTAPSRPRRKIWLYAFTGIFGGAFIGGTYTYYKLQQARTPIGNAGTGTTGIVLPTKPNTPISKKVISPTDNLNLQLVLYQYQTCPFCCKVRTFLDYHGFSYDVVEVNPVMRQQMRWSTYKKVPILLAQVENGYQQLNDSTMIISALTSFMNDQQSGLSAAVHCYPTISSKDEDGNIKTDIMNKYFLMFQDNIPKGYTKESLNEERKWRKWADDVLVHALSPNRYIVIYVGALAMWMIGKRLKKRHNLKDDVRQSLYDECNHLVNQLKIQKTPYLGGSSPNLADLAAFGVLNSIEGCTAFKDLLQHSHIGTWYQNMKEAVQNHVGSAAMGAR